MLYVVQSQYEDKDRNLVVAVQEAISGLSQCVDKTLYFTFFNKYLRGLSFKNDHYCIDVLEVLQVMKTVFIDRHLCSLVTQQGIAQAWPECSAKMILADLQGTRLIDETGSFLPSVTSDTVQTFCKMQSLSPDYLTTAYTMQQYTRDLTDKELSFWSYKIRELCLRLDLQDMVNGTMDDATSDILLMHAQTLVRNYGNNTASKFLTALDAKKVSAHLFLDLFEKCARKEYIFEVVIDKLETAGQLLSILDQLQKYDWEGLRKRQCTTVDIIASLQSQLTSDTHYLSSKFETIISKMDEIVTVEKNRTQTSEFQRSRNTIQADKHFLLVPICEYTKEDIKEWAAAFRDSTIHGSHVPFEHPLFAEAFAVIRRGVTIFFETKKKMRGIVPRDTHMVASLLFIKDLSMQGGASQGTRLMQQISTGEGKTTIICMVAIFKALLGEKVDVVTSSSVLATRDAAGQEFLYNLFDVSVAHCCHEELTRRQKAYESDVIYGDIGSFQRDILETNFYGRAIRTTHGYDNVLIDEVDSMLVDKGETMLYLPHALPNLKALDNVYLEIWSLVNAEGFVGFPDEQNKAHDYLNRKLFGGLPANAFTAISDTPEEKSVEIHCRCISMGLIDPDDHCLTIQDSEEIQHKFGKQLQAEEMMIILQHLETVPLVQMIPKPLHSFVKKSLKSWIQSAVNAKYFRPNKEYIIDIDHRESAADRYPKVIIMDNETGVEQESSEWGSGLHQFLQLKHHLRLSAESLKAVYMSNISFFTPRYTNIMGVTGTLGSNAEYTLFNKLYVHTQLVVLPTNTPSRLRIDTPQCCSTTSSWEEAIDGDISKKHSQGRAVLLICEDVERAKHLHQCFKQKYPQLELYTSSHQEKLEETGESEPGRLIIATNLAGRGTDLKLSKSVRDNGGLHVCLSYLPPNVRVEQQAYGRAARMGAPGSCKLIFFDKEGDLSYAIRKRDLCEAQRVADIEADYYHNIKFQEELFSKFTHEYNAIKAKHKDKPQGRPELDYCLDIWAYFLDGYTDAIESIPSISTEQDREREKDRIRLAFEREVKQKLVEMTLSPARLMQKGHVYMKQAVKRGDEYKDAGNAKDYKEAIKAYTGAVTPGNPFAEYYVAAATFNDDFNHILTSGKPLRTKLKQKCYQLIPQFQDKIKQCQDQITTLQIANRHQDQFLTGGVHYFDEQKQHEMELYQQFISSMQDIVGNEITPKIFDHADWGEDGAVMVFDMVKEMFPLRDFHVSKNYEKRLTGLLRMETTYQTYQAKIKQKIQEMKLQRVVTKQDFQRIFPDKNQLWDQLKRLYLITHETVLKGDESIESKKEERVGYWNPAAYAKGIQFELWDCIDAESFNWIDGLSDNDRMAIVGALKACKVLNQEGQLIELDLSKPFDLPNAYTQYYKHIKDTLWNHSIYRFVLDHLHECAVIDVAHDIDDGNSVGNSLPSQPSPRKAISSASSPSVVDVIISMNPAVNPTSASDINHIRAPSAEMVDPRWPSPNGHAFTMADHIPNETFNCNLLQQLHENNLCETYVSGDGLNCIINAMIQHAKLDYYTPSFKEDADNIRKLLKGSHPDKSGMLHCDDRCAEVILKLVNDKCHATISTVSVVIASNDGPIIYGGTSDKRYPEGRHVVIWQQGNHYVSIVNHSDMVPTTSQRQPKDRDLEQPA